MLSDNEKRSIANLYAECESETEREEMITGCAGAWQVSPMEIRQVLQEMKVYVKKEGKTKKEQYAEALWAITGIDRSEWMKLRYDSQVALMEIFKNG